MYNIAFRAFNINLIDSATAGLRNSSLPYFIAKIHVVSKFNIRAEIRGIFVIHFINEIPV